MAFFSKTVWMLALYLTATIAIPAPQYPVPITPQCIEGDGQIVYTNSKETIISGEGQTGDYTVKGGQSLSQSSTFSTGVTTTVGTDVSIAKIVSLGLSVSVATTTTKSTTQGGNVECPEGPWYCALLIYPEMVEVEGRMTQKNEGITPCKKVPQDYKVRYPVYGDSGAVRSRLEVCSCGNFKGWADPGAPSLHCPDCAAPL